MRDPDEVSANTIGAKNSASANFVLEPITLLRPWNYLITLPTGKTEIVRRRDEPRRIVRRYFAKIARRNNTTSLAPHWLVKPIESRALHSELLPADYYPWHPLKTFEVASHRLYATVVNRLRVAYTLSRITSLPRNVRAALDNLMDEHMLLTLHMETTQCYDDASLFGEVSYGSIAQCRDGKREELPTTSAATLLMPRPEMHFDYGSLPDLMHLTALVSKWGEVNDTKHQDPIVELLVSFFYKNLPVPSRLREHANQLANAIIEQPALYDIFMRLMMATLLGVYPQAAFRADFETRREIYRWMSLRPMTPTACADWVTEHSHTARYIIMEFLFFCIESTPGLYAVFKARYNWDIIVANTQDACDLIRRACDESSGLTVPETLVMRLRAYPLGKNDRADELEVKLRELSVAGTPNRTTHDALYVAATNGKHRFLFRRLAALLRMLPPPTAPLTTHDFESWLRRVDVARDTPLMRHLVDVLRRLVSYWFLGVNAHLNVMHTIQLRYSYRPKRTGFVLHALAVCNHLDDLHYVNPKRRDPPPDFTVDMDAKMRTIVQRYGYDETLGLQWLAVFFNVNFFLLLRLDIAREQFLTETQTTAVENVLREFITPTSSGESPDNYYAYWVIKRFLYWQFATQSVRVYTLPEHIGREQIKRAHEHTGTLRDCTLAPNTMTHLYCVHCKTFKAMFVSHPSDRLPSLKSSKRRRTADDTAEECEAALDGVTANSSATMPAPLVFSSSLYAADDPTLQRIQRENASVKYTDAMTSNASWESFANDVGFNLNVNANLLNAASTTNKKAGKVDTHNRRIEPRFRYAEGSPGVFVNPLDGRHYCKNIEKDAEKYRCALRETADRKCREYAEAYHVSVEEAIVMLTMRSDERRPAQEKALKRYEARRGVTVPVDDDDVFDDPSGNLMRAVLPPEMLDGTTLPYEYRQSSTIDRKRRDTIADIFEKVSGDMEEDDDCTATGAATDTDYEQKIRTQSIKGLSAMERKLQNKRFCGFEALESVNLNFRLFYFFDSYYFKCARCQVPAIATYHSLRMIDGLLVCGFCDTDDCGRNQTAHDVDAAAAQVASETFVERFCVACGPHQKHADRFLRRHVVWDDVTYGESCFYAHDFCFTHWPSWKAPESTFMRLSAFTKGVKKN